jgi:hypothetical protein
MNNDEPVLEYHTVPPTSRAAIFIFVAAIVAAVGFFLIVPALLVMLGAIIIQGNLSQRKDVSGEGLAKAASGISAAAVLLGMVALVLMPSIGSTHVRSNGSVCAANIRGIGQSMAVYAGDNNGAYPIVAFAPYATVPNEAKGTPTAKDVDAALRQYYAVPSPQAGSVQACLWVLVLTGQVAPLQFVCKSDPFAAGGASATDKAGNYYNNFQNGKQLGYSMAYPWNADGRPGAWWTNTSDAGLPIIADMTPASLPKDNKTWNSANHNGDGQNVGFGDSHAEFCRSPNVGHNNDNIYTMSASPSTGPAQFGGIPAGKAAPVLTADKAPYDIIMLPVRNETTGAM